MTRANLHTPASCVVQTCRLASPCIPCRVSRQLPRHTRSTRLASSHNNRASRGPLIWPGEENPRTQSALARPNIGTPWQAHSQVSPGPLRNQESRYAWIVTSAERIMMKPTGVGRCPPSLKGDRTIRDSQDRHEVACAGSFLRDFMWPSEKLT
jgi:hypothetical protein